MAQNYKDYIESVTDDIETCIESMCCQPILFIGSGLSRRYFNAPNWEELLKKMGEQCPKIDKAFAYYKQSYKSLIDIGEAFADYYKEWAWGEGKGNFPDSLFDDSEPPEIYLKYNVSKYFEDITPNSIDSISDDKSKIAELELLKCIQPHSIITTNYDRFLEILFKDYEPIIGQKILRTDYSSVGEIFKIHGCSSERSC